jgi:hypothetical protein
MVKEIRLSPEFFKQAARLVGELLREYESQWIMPSLFSTLTG